MTTPGTNIPYARHVDPAAQGADGNERLTAWAGAALFIGFGLEGITLLNVHWWLTAHMLIGISLLVPTGLKAASTIYRFFRYYTSSPAYVRKGPPQIVLRVIAPFLLLDTMSLLLTGVVIPLSGDFRHEVELLHKASFVTWIALAGIHVLWYMWRVPRLMLPDLIGRDAFRSGALTRIAVVLASGIGGAALALVLMPWVRDWIATMNG